MFVLDNRTLAFMVVITLIVLSLVMQISKFTNKKSSGLPFLTAGNSLLSFAFMLIFFQKALNPFFTIIIANIAIVVAFSLIAKSTYKFFGSKYPTMFYVFCITFTTITFLFFTYVQFNTSVRIIIISFLLGLMAADISRNLFRNVSLDKKGIYYFNTCIFSFLSFYYMLRAITTLFLPYISSLFTSDLSVSIAFIIMVLSSISWTLGLVLMGATKLETELEKNLEALQEEINFRKVTELKLVKSNKRLIELSTLDALTQVFNRRFIMEKYNFEIKRTTRNGSPCSVGLIDLDRFKQVNDTYGHPVGDKVLREIATLIRNSLRQIDFIGRYGGEEFLIILPDTKLLDAYNVLTRIRTEIAEMKWDECELQPTISCGLIEINHNNVSKGPSQLLTIIDEYLYKAKENGRNRIENPEIIVE